MTTAAPPRLIAPAGQVRSPNPATVRLILAALADSRRWRNRPAHAASIADAATLARHTVMRAMPAIEAAGLVSATEARCFIRSVGPGASYRTLTVFTLTEAGRARLAELEGGASC